MIAYHRLGEEIPADLLRQGADTFTYQSLLRTHLHPTQIYLIVLILFLDHRAIFDSRFYSIENFGM